MENEKKPGVPQEKPASQPQEMPVTPAPASSGEVRCDEQPDHKGVWGRLKTWMGRKKKEEIDEEPVDDIYYGIQFRPAQEREKEAADEFAMLFDPTQGPDEEVEQRLFRMQQQRRERVRAAMAEAGVSLEEVDAEYGYGFAESSAPSAQASSTEDKKEEKDSFSTPEAPKRPDPDEKEEKISVSTEETRNFPDVEEEPHRDDNSQPANAQEEDLKNLLFRLGHRSDLPPVEDSKQEKAAPAAVHKEEEPSVPVSEPVVAEEKTAEPEEPVPLETEEPSSSETPAETGQTVEDKEEMDSAPVSEEDTPEEVRKPETVKRNDTVISFADLLQGKNRQEELSSLNEELKKAASVSFEDLLRPQLIDMPENEETDQPEATTPPEPLPEPKPKEQPDRTELSSWSQELPREDDMKAIREEIAQEKETSRKEHKEEKPAEEKTVPPAPAPKREEPEMIAIPVPKPAPPPPVAKPKEKKTGRMLRSVSALLASHTGKKAEKEPGPDPTIYREAEPVAEPGRKFDLLQGLPYAPQETPVHLVPLDALDSALRLELRGYLSEGAAASKKKKKKKVKNRKVDQTMKGGFALGGTEEESNAPEEELPPEEIFQDDLDDYTGPQDIESIRHELRGDMRELLLRTMVTGLCSIMLIVVGFFCEFHVFGDILVPGVPLYITYMIVNMVLYLVAMIFCLRTIGNGLRGLIHLQANADSGLAAASIAVLAQNIMLCFCYDQVSSGSLHVYATLVVLALFLNSWGKLSMLRRIFSNFRFVSSVDEKWAVQLFDQYNTALRLSKGCVVDAPVIAYQRRTHFLSHFLAHSYEPDPAENSAQTLAPIGVLASLALCVGCLVLTKDVPAAISAMSAGMCVCVPFTALLSVNLPMSRLCQTARRFGSMLCGYKAVDRFSRVNALMIDSHDLFPEGAVVLSGIHTFGQQRIDEALLDATALAAKVGGELNDVLSAVIRNRQEHLPRVERPVYEDGRGAVGWVNGRRIMVGNRDLLAAHHIDPPSRDFENQHKAGGQELLYLAVGGELVALFQLQYRIDARRIRQLQNMELSGISLIVRTRNPHITREFLCGRMKLDENSVKVLSEDLGDVYDHAVEGMSEQGEALFATRGRVVSLMRLLPGCVRLRAHITLLVAMQNVSVILGFVLVALLACYSGMGQLTTLSLLLYEGFWALAALLVPRFHKP